MENKTKLTCSSVARPEHGVFRRTTAHIFHYETNEKWRVRNTEHMLWRNTGCKFITKQMKTGVFGTRNTCSSGTRGRTFIFFQWNTSGFRMQASFTPFYIIYYFRVDSYCSFLVPCIISQKTLCPPQCRFAHKSSSKSTMSILTQILVKIDTVPDIKFLRNCALPVWPTGTPYNVQRGKTVIPYPHLLIF